MSLLVVGSIALDTVETPFGRHADILGGSATFFSISASLFTRPRLVGVVGSDFPPEHIKALQKKKIDTAGIEYADGQTFRWNGRYTGDMNSAETLSVHLNVFGSFDPKVPDKFRDSSLVFLANGSTSIQMKVLNQVPKAKFIMVDTMNLWIETEREMLIELIKKANGLILNNHEAAMLTGKHNLIAAAKEILAYGLDVLVIKKGEHGAMLFDRKGNFFAIPAFPLDNVKDPTGAGDSFAGGFMGYLDKAGKTDFNTMKKALVYGTMTASFAVEDFSLNRLLKATPGQLKTRAEKFKKMFTL